jgi:hypothetical protein
MSAVRQGEPKEVDGGRKSHRFFQKVPIQVQRLIFLCQLFYFNMNKIALVACTVTFDK